MVIESSSSFFPRGCEKVCPFCVTWWRSRYHFSHCASLLCILNAPPPLQKRCFTVRHYTSELLSLSCCISWHWCDLGKKKKIKKSHYRQLPLGFSQEETPQQHWSHYWGRTTVWAERERNAKYEVVKCWLQSSHIVGRLLLRLKFIYISEVKLMLSSTAVYFKVSTWILNWHFFKLPVAQEICVKMHDH